MPRPRKIDPIKHCHYCGEQYVRRYHPGGALMRHQDFITSSYCSRACILHDIAQKRRELRESHRKGAPV